MRARAHTLELGSGGRRWGRGIRSGAGAEAGRDGGFTLVELLAVLSVLTVLMGVGVGFMLRKGSPMEQTVAIVRDQVRLAAVSAKSRSAPTEVLLVKGDGDRVQLRVRGLEPIAAWHCEPGERPFHEQVRGDILGSHAPGRFGMALRPDLEARTALMRVPTAGRPMWDLRDGFLLRLDVRLDARAACTLAQLGRAFVLGLDGDATPEVKVALRSGATQGPSKSVRARAVLALRRWVTIDVIHDGSTLELVVDGRSMGRVEARGAPFQRDSDDFEVSPVNSGVPGLLDEIQLWAYALAEPVDLPAGTALEGMEGGVRFLPTGEPEAVYEVTIKAGEQTERYRIAPGGVLQ